MRAENWGRRKKKSQTSSNTRISSQRNKVTKDEEGDRDSPAETTGLQKKESLRFRVQDELSTIGGEEKSNVRITGSKHLESRLSTHILTEADEPLSTFPHTTSEDRRDRSSR